MLKLRVSGALPFFPLYVVMEWKRTALSCVGENLSVREEHTLRCLENYLHLRNKKVAKNLPILKLNGSADGGSEKHRIWLEIVKWGGK
jgi:hypothetical protein